MEVGGNNRGPRIEQYLARLGLAPGLSYCAAFVYWCWDEAAKELKLKNPLPRTGSVLKLWERSPLRCRTATPVVGAVFCHESGGGLGHTGIVTDLTHDDFVIYTVEGNTNPAGARDGQGVFSKTRPAGYINLGFLDFSRLEDPDEGGNIAIQNDRAA